MGRSRVPVMFLLAVIVALSLAIAAALSCRAMADPSPPLPPVIVRILTWDAIVEPDGAYTATFHVEKLATNSSAAQNIAQYRLELSENMETVEVLEAFTRKANGNVLPVEPSKIFVQAPPGSPQLPMFTDHKQKVVVFPDVAAEDTVVYTVRQTRNPAFAGHFFGGGVFQRGTAFEDVQATITLPKTMHAYVEARGVDHQSEEAADNITHTFRYSNPRPRVSEPTALSPWDTDPQYTISTFAGYAAVASAYRRLSESRVAVTPRIQALADEITAGITDRREQAHRIYDWVSSHIRWVAVWLGNGGWEPHDSATILANGYGDCKDHVVLLAALLEAKGIASIPALINSGNRYTLPEAATPAVFNHVISYLPEFELYVDSTIGMAPFGTLPPSEYGKPVALAAETDAGLRTLPPVAAEDNEETLTTTAELKADGTVSGQSTTTASGPFAVKLRQLAASVEVRGQEPWAQSYFKSLGWPGKARFRFDPPRDRLSPGYTFSASFDLEARPEFFEGKAFELPGGVAMLVRPGEFLVGSWTLKKAEPTPCSSGHQVEELSLTLPAGRDIELLPSGKTVENAYLRYQSHWSRDGQVVTVRREFTARLPVAVCRDEIRAQLADAVTEIRGDYRSTIALRRLGQ